MANAFRKIIASSFGTVTDAFSDVGDAVREKASRVVDAAEKVSDAGRSVRDFVTDENVRKERFQAAGDVMKKQVSNVDVAFGRTGIGSKIQARRMDRMAEEQAAADSVIHEQMANREAQTDAYRAEAAAFASQGSPDTEWHIDDANDLNQRLMQLMDIGMAEDTDEAMRRMGNAVATAVYVDPDDIDRSDTEIPNARLLYENTDEMSGFTAREWELEDGRRYYEGELGKFIYDPSEFQITDAENIEGAPGTVPEQTHRPCLHYIGKETDGSKIRVPEGLTSMFQTFAGTEVTSTSRIPESVRDITGCWANCKNLTHANNLIIPLSVDSAAWTFCGCESLEKGPAVIPGSVKEMYGMFAYCKSLKKPPVLRKGIESCDMAFAGCENLETEPKLPKSAYSWEGMTDGCLTLQAQRVSKDKEEIARERERLEASFDKKAMHEKLGSGLAALMEFHMMTRAGYGVLGSALITYQGRKNGTLTTNFTDALVMSTVLRGRGSTAMMLARGLQNRNEAKQNKKEAARQAALDAFDAAVRLKDTKGTFGSKYDVQMYSAGMKDVTSDLLYKIGNTHGRRHNGVLKDVCDTSKGITQSMASHMAAKQRSAERHAKRAGTEFNPEDVHFTNDERLKYSKLMRVKLSSFVAYDAGVRSMLEEDKGKIIRERGHDWAEKTMKGFEDKQKYELADFFYNVEKQQDQYHIYSKNALRQMQEMAAQISGAMDIWKEAAERYQTDKAKEAEAQAKAQQEWEARNARREARAERAKGEPAPNPNYSLPVLDAGEGGTPPRDTKKVKPALYTVMGFKSDMVKPTYGEPDADGRRKMEKVELTIPLSQKQAVELGMDKGVSSITISASPNDIRVQETGKTCAVSLNQDATYEITALNGDTEFAAGRLGSKITALTGATAVSLLSDQSLITPTNMMRIRDELAPIYMPGVGGHETASSAMHSSHADKEKAAQAAADSFQRREDAMESQKRAAEASSGESKGTVKNPPAVSKRMPGRIYGEDSGLSKRGRDAQSRFGDIIDGTAIDITGPDKE